MEHNGKREKTYAVLIPAYKPDGKMTELARDLCRQGVDVLIVDDGSGSEYEDLFARSEAEGATVLRHEANRGKGAAIKTGIAALQRAENIAGVVTADADGQHTVGDILHVIAEMRHRPGTIVIGSRAFSGDVPWRSRAGNRITHVVFRFATGLSISDTQTGLRGLPRDLFPRLLALAGNRYDYEMNMLLMLEKWKAPYVEVPTETVYIEGNRSSHFHTVRDSWRIYRRIFAFIASSLIACLVDYGAFALFSLVLHFVPWSGYVLARVISSGVNYAINRNVVFGSGKRRSILRYYALALCIMAAGSAGVHLLTSLGIHGILSKLMIDIPLFLVSYTVQRTYVFRS